MKSITVTHTLPAAPAEVFTMWSSREKLEEWFCPEEMSCKLPVFHFNEGGNFRVEMFTRSEQNTATGVFKKITSNEELGFTWKWESDNTETEVRVSFTEKDGATQVELVHSGFESDDWAEQHIIGWTSTLNHLARVL